MQLSSSSCLSAIDVSGISTRQKKQLIFQTIQQMVGQQCEPAKIADHILTQYQSTYTREQLERIVQKYQAGNLSQLSCGPSEELRAHSQVNSGLSKPLLKNPVIPTPQQPPRLGKPAPLVHPRPEGAVQRETPKQGGITQYLKTNEQALKCQVDELTKQLREQREQAKQLEQQLSQTKTEQNQQLMLNKVRLALRVHEAEAAEICQRHARCKEYERFRASSTGQGSQNLYEDRLNIQLQQLHAKLREIDNQLDQKNQPSRYTLIIEYNNVQQEILKLQQILEQAPAKVEESLLNERIFSNLKEKNRFKDFQLPCFYPTHDFMQNPLASGQQIALPAVQPKYILLRLIGEGGFSKVFKAFNIATCDLVALKISTLEQSNEAKWRLIQREAAVYQRLEHSNIVRLNAKPLIVKKETAQKGAYDLNPNINSATEQKAAEIALEMELCDDQSLFDFVCIQSHRIMNLKEREQNEKLLISIFFQLSQALQYLHEQNLTHNDISLSNVLRKGPLWKLSDFSLAKEVEEFASQQSVTTLGTTRPFAPPEKVLERKFSTASDMYSFGVVMFAAVTGSIRLFDEIGQAFCKKQELNPAERVKEFFEQNQPAVCSCQDEIRQLIVKLVDVDHTKRPTAAQVSEALAKFLQRNIKRQRK